MTEGERLARVEQKLEDVCKKVCNGEDSLVARFIRMDEKLDTLMGEFAGLRVKVAVLWGAAALAGSAVGMAVSKLLFG